MDTTSVNEQPEQQALVPAPPGTTPNKLVKYAAGSVVAPSSVIASQAGVKNVSGNTSNHQVPQ